MAESPLEGGDLLVRALEERGVEQMFSVSGGPINSAYNATERSRVRIVHTRHEAGAAFMADAVYRATRVPGVALVTLGPGVTNTATPAGNALRAGVPMLIVGGQAGSAQRHRGAGMELPTMEVMRPVTKWAASVPSPDRIPEFVALAWSHMLGGTPGPVYLEIPADVLGAPVEESVPFPASPAVRGAAPDRASYSEAATALASAKRPLLLVGDDVFHSRAEAVLTEFAAATRIPYATLRMARGALDETSPFSIGPGYTPANPVLRRALAQADTVLLLGHPWEFDLGFGADLAESASVIHVHPDAGVLGRNNRADIAVHSTAANFLAELPGHKPGAMDAEWASGLAREWQEHRESVIAQARAEEGPAHPVALADEVMSALPEDARFVTSHGNIDFWIDAYLAPRGSGNYLRAGQSGTLGAELPYGVAARMVSTDQPVVVFVGDGGIGYAGIELETAVRYGAPLIVVVADDEKWAAIALPQRDEYGTEVELDLPRRDWVGFARSLGGHGVRAESLKDVRPALAEALDSGLPSIIHVPVTSVLSPYMRHISG